MALNIVETGPSLEDRKQLYKNGLQTWSREIAIDYERLIEQAFIDLSNDPHRIGAKPVYGRKDGLYQYPLIASKKNIDVVVKDPSHAVFYFTFDDKDLVIARIVRPSAERQIKKISKKEADKERSGREDDGIEM